MSEIMVSICVLSYNHEKYLRDCLDGIVMQKTSFPIEAWVHDDASTDSSADIIKEYQQKYPDIIKPILQKENQYSKLHGGILDTIVFPQCIGKYIALCEGDDYWTDPYKLQKQVAFMEAHPECSVSFHRCKHLNTYTNQWSDDGLDKYIINNEPTEISIPQFFKHWCTQPLTMIYRRSSYDTSIRAKYKHFWDMYFIYHLLCAGKGYLLPFVGGVHIIQAKGMSGGLQSEVQRCEFELISADELHAVNHNKYTKKYWQDTVIWSWNTFEHSGEKQKLRGLILKEWRMFPWDMTEVMWIQTKRKIKSWLKK